MENIHSIIIKKASSDDFKYAGIIADALTISAKERGVQIEPRTASYIQEKIASGNSVIALHAVTGEWVGFCSLEIWEHEKFIANTALIISNQYRGLGLSKEIKKEIFNLCRVNYPNSKIFSLTANPAVIQINQQLGFKTVPYIKILSDSYFLDGCNSWVNYKEIMKNGHAGHVAMIFDPENLRSSKKIHLLKKKVFKKIKLFKKRKVA